MNSGMIIGYRGDLVNFIDPAPKTVGAEFSFMSASFSRRVQARRQIQGNCSQFSRAPQSRHRVSHRKRSRDFPQLPHATKRSHTTFQASSGCCRRVPAACRRAPRTGYSPPRFYRRTILPVNVSLVNIGLISINADCNGLRPSAIPEENHFPKPGVCGILKDREPCNFSRAML